MTNDDHADENGSPCELQTDPAMAEAPDAPDAVAGLSLEASDASAMAATEIARAFEEARGRLQRAATGGLDVGSATMARFAPTSDPVSVGFGSRFAGTFQQVVQLNGKAFEAWHRNAESTIAHCQTLAGVRSWSDAMSLNAEFTRTLVETMTAQGREFAELAGRMARPTSDPSTSGMKRDATAGRA